MDREPAAMPITIDQFLAASEEHTDPWCPGDHALLERIVEYCKNPEPANKRNVVQHLSKDVPLHRCIGVLLEMSQDLRQENQTLQNDLDDVTSSMKRWRAREEIAQRKIEAQDTTRDELEQALETSKAQLQVVLRQHAESNLERSASYHFPSCNLSPRTDAFETLASSQHGDPVLRRQRSVSTHSSLSERLERIREVANDDVLLTIRLHGEGHLDQGGQISPSGHRPVDPNFFEGQVSSPPHHVGGGANEECAESTDRDPVQVGTLDSR